MNNNLCRQRPRRFESVCVTCVHFTIFTHKKINFTCLTCDHKLWTSIPRAHMSHMTSGLCQVRQARFPGSPSFSSSRLPSISQGLQRTQGQSFWEKKIRQWGNTRGNTKVTKVMQIGKTQKSQKGEVPKERETRWVNIRDHQIKTKGFNWPLSVLSLYKDLQVLQGQAGTVLSTIVTQ